MEATSILAGFHAFLYPGQINLEFNLEMLLFVKGGNLENKNQTQPTYGTSLKSNPGNIAGRQALSLLCHPASQE